MTENICLTISERHRENTETIRITGHTADGKTYAFHIKGENAWWFESFLKAGTQITLRPLETYAIDTVQPQGKTIQIPPENTLKVEKAAPE